MGNGLTVLRPAKERSLSRARGHHIAQRRLEFLLAHASSSSNRTAKDAAECAAVGEIPLLDVWVGQGEYKLNRASDELSKYLSTFCHSRLVGVKSNDEEVRCYLRRSQICDIAAQGGPDSPLPTFSVEHQDLDSYLLLRGDSMYESGDEIGLRHVFEE